MNNLRRTIVSCAALFCVYVGVPLSWQSGAAAVASEPEPLSLIPVEQGAPSVTVTGLPSTAAVSGSVTGPFLIAMQTNYAYGSIDGIRFGTTASTNGQCDESTEYGCTAYLLIETLPSAAVGLDYGTVTLSDGSSFTVASNVRPPGLIISPRALVSSTFAGNTGDPLRVSITNATAAAITIGKPSYVEDSTPSPASFITFGGNCGNSLAAGATCVVDTFYAPTANLSAEGWVQIPTGLGPIDVPFEAVGETPPANLKVDLQYIDFDVGANGSSAVRTITITNPTTALQATEIPTAGDPCDPSVEGQCLKIVSDNCQRIPAQGTCEIKVEFLVDPTRAFTGTDDENFIDLDVTSASGSGLYPIEYVAFAAPGPPSGAVIAASPATLQFPATPFGQGSDPKSLTVKNVSSGTLTIAIPSIADFIADPSCTQLLPGASCEVLVRYVPTSGNPQSAGSLTVTATDVADPTGLTPAQSQQVVAVSGSSIAPAALASPAFGSVVLPIVVQSSVSLDVTNTATVPLVFGSISGNLNYYAGEALVVDTTGCGAILAPGKTCKLVVNAHKCDDSVVPACYLTIYSNALSSPDVYAFAGDQPADNHSMLTVESAPVVFGQTPTGKLSASQIVHVTLTNAASAVSVPFDVLPILDPDFKIDNQCPKVLVPQAASGSGFSTSCQIMVTFAPQSQGFHVGALTYRSSLKGDSVVLAGTGGAPALSVDPASLKFPSTAAGSSSVAQVVTVKNSGSSAITITGITLAGGQADDFIVAKTCGASLAAGASCTITVTFKPVSAGIKDAYISIADNAGGSPQTIALTGTGTSSATPSVQLSASSLTFSSQAAGTSSAAQTVTLTNSGSASVAFSSITVAGGQADDYVLSKTCGASLAAGASCTLSVTFKPVSAGTKVAHISISDNASGSPQSVALTGTGTAAPIVELSATSVTFSTQSAGTSSAPQTVTVTNSGGASLTLSSIRVLGSQADDFVLSKTCGASLAAGASCTLSVTFKPVSAGNKAARISITDNAGGSPQTVALTGTGT